jgi:hypothetical protein
MIENAPLFKSRNGTDLKLYNMAAGGSMPIHGAYYSGTEEEWIPVAWDEYGKVQGNRQHPLDIDFEQTVIA